MLCCVFEHHVYMIYSYSVLKGVDYTCINYCFSFSAWHNCSVYPGHLNPGCRYEGCKITFGCWKQVTFEIDDFKSFSASSFLLFIQECLFRIKESSVKTFTEV